jgi:hypothetical protein
MQASGSEAMSLCHVLEAPCCHVLGLTFVDVLHGLPFAVGLACLEYHDGADGNACEEESVGFLAQVPPLLQHALVSQFIGGVVSKGGDGAPCDVQPGDDLGQRTKQDI